MTTKEAFTNLVAKRLWYRDLGLTRLTAASIKSRFQKDDGRISVEKIESLLLKAGYRVKEEKKWIK